MKTPNSRFDVCPEPIGRKENSPISCKGLQDGGSRCHVPWRFLTLVSDCTAFREPVRRPSGLTIGPVSVGMHERPSPGYNHWGRLALRALPQLKQVTMESLHAKNVIIGAGAMGSSAAYHLARRGEPVVLIEQFALGHDRGSSHGAARITRHSYADPAYARLMPAAFRAWRDFEADAGETVYLRTGGVSFSPQGVDYAERVAANLCELQIPHWRSSGRAWNARYGAIRCPLITTLSSSPTPACSQPLAPLRFSSGSPATTAAGRRGCSTTPRSAGSFSMAILRLSSPTRCGFMRNA